MESNWFVAFWIFGISGLSGCATNYPSLSKEAFDERPARVVLKTPYIEAEYEKKRLEESSSRGALPIGNVLVTSLTVLAITGGKYIALPRYSGGDREVQYPARFIYRIKTRDEASMDILEAYDGFNEGECVRLLRGQESKLYRLAVGYLGTCDAIPK
ncbi:MAG: hypothetical protein IV108_14345 [Burkholderiales bacterium]|nr:hypothetical protein [Burkholderiales bacterium]